MAISRPAVHSKKPGSGTRLDHIPAALRADGRCGWGRPTAILPDAGPTSRPRPADPMLEPTEEKAMSYEDGMAASARSKRPHGMPGLKGR